MKCTVIGGCGFLGRHLVEGLQEKGYEANVFDMKTTFKSYHPLFFSAGDNFIHRGAQVEQSQ